MSESKPLSLVAVGEGMLELRGQGTQYASSFAGDVLNFGVYLKRLCPAASVALFSATGEDLLSEEFVEFLNQEKIGTQLIFRSNEKTLGLYMVHTDDTGERSFTYWRSDSAARQMFSLADGEELRSNLETSAYFFFSGITLAILNPAERLQLLDLAQQLRDKGKTIVFDPNYRPTLWENLDTARSCIENAYRIANIVLSGFEDEQTLFGLANAKAVQAHFQAFDIDELILTNGANAISALRQGEWIEVRPEKPTEVIDTTSAGDAFNAGYLAARHAGFDLHQAIQRASALAAIVVASPGAILPASKIATIRACLNQE